MPSEVIRSAANPFVRRVRSLADRRERRRQGAFVVEGVAPVWAAVTAGADIETLVIAPDLLAGSPAGAMVAEQETSGVPVTRLNAEVFGRLSSRDGPAGLLAIVRGRLAPLSELVVGSGSYVVALDEVANPGNLGTIIRTADALGASGVILSGHSTDPYSPQAVKAAMGSLFALPVVSAQRLDAVFDWAEARGLATITTSAHAATELPAAELPFPAVVVLGSERTGLPAAALERGTVSVRIPMRGSASSLNLAVAAGIVLHEVSRRLPLP